jgi:hypothetical protein
MELIADVDDETVLEVVVAVVVVVDVVVEVVVVVAETSEQLTEARSVRAEVVVTAEDNKPLTAFTIDSCPVVVSWL